MTAPIATLTASTRLLDTDLTGTIELYPSGGVILRLKPRGGGILGEIKNAADLTPEQATTALTAFVTREGWTAATP